MPKFELMAFRTNDWPGMAERVGDAGRLEGDLLDLRRSPRPVRSSEAESGSWMFDDQVALVLDRDEAGRGCGVKPKPVRPSRPT